MGRRCLQKYVGARARQEVTEKLCLQVFPIRVACFFSHPYVANSKILNALRGLRLRQSFQKPGGGNSLPRQQSKEATSCQGTFLLSFSLLRLWLEPKWRRLLLQEALESCFVLLSPFRFLLRVKSLDEVSLVFSPLCFLSVWF